MVISWLRAGYAGFVACVGECALISRAMVALVLCECDGWPPLHQRMQPAMHAGPLASDGRGLVLKSLGIERGVPPISSALTDVCLCTRLSYSVHCGSDHLSVLTLEYLGREWPP